MLTAGGQGGGTNNSNVTIACRYDPTPVFCLEPGESVPAEGGTSFASSMVSSAVFQLGPQNAPREDGPGPASPENDQGNGYVQVVRVG